MLYFLLFFIFFYTKQSKRNLTSYYRTYDYFIDVNHGQKYITVHYLHIDEAHIL